MRRVFIIGLDGADFRLIDPWVKAGQLPTLARLMADGSRCILRSTIRPESSLAWASFSTGVNPGKHSLFGFVRVEPGTYRSRVLTAYDVKAPRFWQIAGQAGKRVGIINVPMTYPPEPVNGYLVAGMLTPGTASFAYPPDLSRELATLPGGYQIDVEAPESDRAEFLRQTDRCVQQRLQAIDHLSRTRPSDLLVAVFTEPDRVQHFFWADMAPDHPLQPTPAYPEALLDLYRKIDTGLAQLLAELDDETLVLLVSDHGFNACARKFYVNTWLHQAGFLTWRSTTSNTKRLEAAMQRLRKVGALRALKQRLPGLGQRSLLRELQQQAFAETVDWTATRAFFSEEGGIRINLKNREPSGIVAPGREYEEMRETLRQQLLQVIDPVTQAPVIEAVYRREELYTGPYMELAPDLIAEPYRDQIDPKRNVLLGSVAASSSPQVMGSSSPYTANHAVAGIFIAYGHDVQCGAPYSQAHLVDIAPTVLAYLGIPIPAEMDGQILSDLFVPAVKSQLTSISRDLSIVGTAADEDVYTASEEAEVMQRLRDLGYLG